VDEAVRRVLRVKFGLGLFEHPYADEARESERDGSAGESRLGAHSCRKIFVLLKMGSSLEKYRSCRSRPTRNHCADRPLADDPQ